MRNVPFTPPRIFVKREPTKLASTSRITLAQPVNLAKPTFATALATAQQARTVPTPKSTAMLPRTPVTMAQPTKPAVPTPPAVQTPWVTRKGPALALPPAPTPPTAPPTQAAPQPKTTTTGPVPVPMPTAAPPPPTPTTPTPSTQGSQGVQAATGTQAGQAGQATQTTQSAPAAQAAQTTQSAPATTTPLPLESFPRPRGDNGRGMHWIPTTSSTPAVVDRFVSEAQRMGVKWVTFLNNGADTGPNDYLVKKLVGAGIEPVMRIYSPTLAPIKGDVEGMVRHYVGMGVHYFQPYNEPNLKVEQPDGVPSVARYVDNWVPAAKAVLRGGGLPGFGSLSPGGDYNDVEFLRESLRTLKSRGEVGVLDKAWISMHNYSHNNPIDVDPTTAPENIEGFMKFRTYNRLMREELGRSVPLIGTEGGTFVGDQQDRSRPVVDERRAVDMVRDAYEYMRDDREPWNLAYSYWVIANEAGGGSDPGFARHALFKADGSVSGIVDALRAMG